MTKFANGNYKERLQEFIFERNWIELPLFWNNDESIRFDFESRSEAECAATINSVLDDLFFCDSEMFVVFYGSKYTKAGFGKRRYFNPIRMRKIFKQHFISRDKWN